MNSTQLSQLFKSRPDIAAYFTRNEATLGQLETLSTNPSAVARLVACPPRSDALFQLQLESIAFEDLAREVAGWPAKSPQAQPSGFGRAAEAVQSAFDVRWTALFSEPDEDRRREAAADLVKLSNAALSKPGHTDNVACACKKFLESPELQGLVPSDDHARIFDAAKYLNLCDSSPEVPVAVTAGKGSFDAVRPFLAKRAGVSARLLEEARLTDDSRTVDHVRQHKNPETDSIPAQFLRLMDAVMGMSAKPFFRNANGGVDGVKVLGALQSDKGEAPHALFDAIAACIRQGILDECLSSQRQYDHYVR